MLSEDQNNAAYQINSFEPGKIVINKEVLTHSVIISPNQLIKNWHPKTVDEMSENDLLQILALKPDIILIGTGEKSMVLPAKKLAPLLQKQFHAECMSTQAACRTYMILSAEGRNCVAGLMV